LDAEKLGRSWLMNLIFRPSGWVMESRLRGRLHDARKMLRAGGLEAGQTVLEVGCGSGFFTLPAAEILGARGRLIAIEPLTAFVERVRTRLREAGLSNVEVHQRDALETGLDDATVDVVLLYGVLPFPTLPLDRLLPEMHRVLKPGGILAVWMYPISFGVPAAIGRCGLFAPLGRQDGVDTLRRV